MDGHDLAAALNGELGADSPSHFLLPRPDRDNGVTVLTHGDRAVSVYFSGSNGFYCGFWWKGREQAHGWTQEIPSAAGAARLWIDGADLRGMSTAHLFVEYSDFQVAYEQGDAVEFQWQRVLEQVDGDYGSFRELVRLASEEPDLRRRFPQLGHKFVLSENEDSRDVLFSIFMIRPEWYASYKKDGSGFEFEGTARDVVDIMLRAIRARSRETGP
jgi:hypothetical protein